MKSMTKIGLLLTILAALSTTACSSSDKAEVDAEQALVEQTADLQVDQDLQNDSDLAFSDEDLLDDANLGASSSGLGH